MPNLTTIPRTEFAAALNQVANDRGIDPQMIIESIKLAVVTAYKKDFPTDEEHDYEAEVDPQTGETRIFSFLLTQPKKRTEITPPGYGRIAAQQARNIIIQKIREAEKGALLEEYEKRVGNLVNGMVLRFDGDNTVIDLGKGEGVMPNHEKNPDEQYRLNQKLTFYLEGIRETAKGRQIIVSRAHVGLVEGLFKREVPEIASGVVEIRAIAREPGSRTKIAVYSNQSGVDPVGSCVGQKGVRVQAVINEISGEKIDVIQFNEDPEKFILSALSPSENLTVKLNPKEKSAEISAPEEQLSLAIGKGGQNVRLAGKLTGWHLTIKNQDDTKKSSNTSSKTTKKKTKKEKPLPDDIDIPEPEDQAEAIK